MQLYIFVFFSSSLSQNDFFFPRETFLKDAEDADALTTLCSLISLSEKMQRNEVQQHQYSIIDPHM